MSLALRSLIRVLLLESALRVFTEMILRVVMQFALTLRSIRTIMTSSGNRLTLRRLVQEYRRIITTVLMLSARTLSSCSITHVAIMSPKAPFIRLVGLFVALSVQWIQSTCAPFAVLPLWIVVKGTQA